MEAEFYLKDVNHGKNIKEQEVIEKDVLHFKMKRQMHGQDEKHVTEFDNVASRQHVVQFEVAYKKFKRANLSFKLKWAELDFEVVPEPVVVVEVVEAPQIEEVKVEEAQPEVVDEVKEAPKRKKKTI